MRFRANAPATTLAAERDRNVAVDLLPRLAGQIQSAPNL